jgi:hypothetical protein
MNRLGSWVLFACLSICKWDKTTFLKSSLRVHKNEAKRTATFQDTHTHTHTHTMEQTNGLFVTVAKKELPNSGSGWSPKKSTIVHTYYCLFVMPVHMHRMAVGPDSYECYGIMGLCSQAQVFVSQSFLSQGLPVLRNRTLTYPQLHHSFLFLFHF